MLPLFILAIENDDDRQFVADIYTRYRPALYRKAQKVLHDNDRAEEAVHEAMLRVIRYLDRVREIPSDELLPYLITIVQTTSISIYNKYKQHRETVFGTAEDWAACLSDNGSCIDNILIREDRIELLKMCLKQLTQREIDILNYFYTLDLSLLMRSNTIFIPSLPRSTMSPRIYKESSEVKRSRSFIYLS